MNAVSLYIKTCRRIIECGSEDSLRDIDRLLSYLRQALSCCVCGGLLIVPMSSSVSSCQHPVCKGCVGRKMNIKPSCSWCKDYAQYTEDIHMRILLQLYKKLCEYCVSISLPRRFTNENGNTNINFAELVQEGVDFRDDFDYEVITNCLPLPLVDGATDQHVPSLPVNGQTNGVYSVTVSEDNSNKIMIKRTSAENNNNNNEATTKRLRTSFKNSKSKFKKKGCRCGLATPNPGKLTCCGQRCPCYVENKACVDCRCRGCRNPHKLDEGCLSPKLETEVTQHIEDASDVELDC